ncbi:MULTISPECIES: hypothetical protein [Salibacter]|jgi:hypothetical protein|nr:MULTISPECIES: hypothetical protein [Salibacter]MDR9397572.1 hypothetical protein [Salibacter sp.]MDR9486988.1 hypothetical protein [Salibacter sp.]
MLSDRKNILILFMSLIIVAFAFFSYHQNTIIDVLNNEILKQAQHRQNLLLDKYKAQKEADSLRIELLKSKSER